MELEYRVGRLLVALPKAKSDYYHQYPIQNQPQPAYLELRLGGDVREPRLFADWNGEIGNAVPFDVYHGRTLRFGFPCEAKLKTVREAIRTVAPMCAKLCESYDVEWDGHNWVGKYDAELAEQIEQKVWDCFGWD